MNLAVEAELIRELNARTGAHINSIKHIRVLKGANADRLPQKAIALRVMRKPDMTPDGYSRAQFKEDLEHDCERYIVNDYGEQEKGDHTNWVGAMHPKDVIGIGKNQYEELVRFLKARMKASKASKPNNILSFNIFAKTP